MSIGCPSPCPALTGVVPFRCSTASHTLRKLSQLCKRPLLSKNRGSSISSAPSSGSEMELASAGAAGPSGWWHSRPRLCATHFSFRSGSERVTRSSSATEIATIRSSFVGTTQADTADDDFEMRGPPASFAASSSSRSIQRRGKGTSLNSTCLTPKPLASSIYVHVPEAPSSHERSMSVTSLFPSHGRMPGECWHCGWSRSGTRRSVCLPSPRRRR